MKKEFKLKDAFAIAIGIILLIEGIWGMCSNIVFGVLSTNKLHAVIHIVLGIIGIAVGFKQNARGFCLFLGILLLLVGVLRFIPGADMFVVKLLNVNIAVAYFNISVGIISILVSFSPRMKDIKNTAGNGR